MKQLAQKKQDLRNALIFDLPLEEILTLLGFKKIKKYRVIQKGLHWIIKRRIFFFFSVTIPFKFSDKSTAIEYLIQIENLENQLL